MTPTPTLALFCGSRHWTDKQPIYEAVMQLPNKAVVIHGGAPGADRIAGQLAADRGLHVAEVNALWNILGTSAGPRRNQAMMLLRPTIVYAFPLQGAVGTQHMIGLAREAGIRVVEFVYEQATTTHTR